MFKHHEMIRNLLAILISNINEIQYFYQMIHLSLHEIHADFVMFSKYSRHFLQLQVNNLQGSMLLD